MDNTKNHYKNIDEYISQFPQDIQSKLLQLRRLIKEVSPNSLETIKYRMPTFMLNGKNLVYFAAFKNHIGFFPFPSSIEYFKKETSNYKTSKGTIQFPLNQELPLELIEKIVKYRISKLSKN